MTGIVNLDLEAVLRLSVGDAAGHSHDVEAVNDTGFNGFLTLPPALFAALHAAVALPPAGATGGRQFPGV